MQTGQVLEAQVAALDPLLPACGRHQIWLGRVLFSARRRSCAGASVSRKFYGQGLGLCRIDCEPGELDYCNGWCASRQPEPIRLANAISVLADDLPADRRVLTHSVPDAGRRLRAGHQAAARCQSHRAGCDRAHSGYVTAGRPAVQIFGLAPDLTSTAGHRHRAVAAVGVLDAARCRSPRRRFWAQSPARSSLESRA